MLHHISLYFVNRCNMAHYIYEANIHFMHRLKYQSLDTVQLECYDLMNYQMVFTYR